MADRNDRQRQLASIRRNLENLTDEVETAEGAMPQGGASGDQGVRNFRVVLQRLEKVEELAGETADKLRSVLSSLED